MHDKSTARIRSTLLNAIEAYCREQGLSESRFGVVVVNDSHFVSRLRDGRGRLSTLETVEGFLYGQGSTDNSVGAAFR